jgi:hypothetical protein
MTLTRARSLTFIRQTIQAQFISYFFRQKLHVLRQYMVFATNAYGSQQLSAQPAEPPKSLQGHSPPLSGFLPPVLLALK